MEQTTTTELVSQAIAGDSQAWRQLVERYRDVIWAASGRFRFDRHTRDDVFQLTCLRLLDHLGHVRDPERLAGWLAVTARRECLAIIRQRDRVQVVDQFDGVASPDPPSEAQLLLDERARAVAEGLAELDAACRELLRLLVAEPPLSYQEIAEVLGRPIGSIGPTRARCLDKLAQRPAIVRITDAGRASNAVEGAP